MAQFYTTKQISELCGVHITTAIRWIDAGELRAFRTPGGRRRVAGEDLREFLRKLKLPLPDALKEGKLSVLVVDEDTQQLKAAQRSLKSSDGFEVATTTSALEALLTIGADQPQVVVVDSALSAVDAWELVGVIKKTAATSHIAVVVLSNKVSSELEARAAELGAAACLAKQTAFARLRQVIEEASGRRAAPLRPSK